jgi:hypothetical protein
MIVQPVSISMDVNHVARKIHVAFPTMKNGHLMAACEELLSDVPPDESSPA